MGLSIIPLTSEQNFNTTTPSTAEAVITAATPLIAHTCPAGKKQRGHAIFIVTIWGGAGRNLRARVQGVQIKQFDDTNQPVGSEGAQLITPIVSLGAGDTISVTTQNAGTEGGSMRVSFIITNEVSV